MTITSTTHNLRFLNLPPLHQISFISQDHDRFSLTIINHRLLHELFNPNANNLLKAAPITQIKHNTQAVSSSIERTAQSLKSFLTSGVPNL